MFKACLHRCWCRFKFPHSAGPLALQGLEPCLESREPRACFLTCPWTHICSPLCRGTQLAPLIFGGLFVCFQACALTASLSESGNSAEDVKVYCGVHSVSPLPPLHSLWCNHGNLPLALSGWLVHPQALPVSLLLLGAGHRNASEQIQRPS